MTKTTDGVLYTETIMQMAFDCDRIEDTTNTVKSAKRIIDDVTTVGGDKNESKPKKAKIKSRKQMEIEQARANAFAWSQKDLCKIATRRFL